MENVMVPKELLLHLIEYWNGNRNETAMFDALEHITDELDKLLAAAPTPVEPMASMDYAVALQRAIEYHCRGEIVPEFVAKDCPHHARRLNESLASPPADKQAAPNKSSQARAILDSIPQITDPAAIEILEGLTNNVLESAGELPEHEGYCHTKLDTPRQVHACNCDWPKRMRTAYSALAARLREREAEIAGLNRQADILRRDLNTPSSDIEEMILKRHGHFELALKTEQAKARIAELERALRKIARGPIMPLPDPIAHSWQAFGRGAHSALCDCIDTARAAVDAQLATDKGEG